MTCRHRSDRRSKSAASRRFVALSAARLADFMAAGLSALDLLVVQIDGLHLGDDLVLVAAIGADGEGNEHPLALVEGATEDAATVQALLNNLVSRGLDPTVPRLFNADGAVEGDLLYLRFGRCDPALPDPQGAQHHGTPAERASCGHPSGAALGLGA